MEGRVEPAAATALDRPLKRGSPIRTSSGRRHASRGSCCACSGRARARSTTRPRWEEVHRAIGTSARRTRCWLRSWTRGCTSPEFRVTGCYATGGRSKRRWRRFPHRGRCVAAGPRPAAVLSARLRLGATHPRCGHRDAAHRSEAHPLLKHLAEETSSGMKGNDVDGVIVIRSSAASLAFALFEHYEASGLELPEAIQRWRELCSASDEFSEVRNAWTDAGG